MKNKTKFKNLSKQIDSEIRFHLDKMRLKQYIINLQSLAYDKFAIEKIADKLTDLIMK